MLMVSPAWNYSHRHRVVVISDLHFPRPDSHPKYLYEFLLNNPSDMLVILGDFFEGYDKEIGAFNEWHWRCMDLMNKRKMEEGMRVVIVPGNHDKYLRHERVLGHSLYGSIYNNNLVLHEGGQRTFLTHGDEFDPKYIRRNDRAAYQAADEVRIWGRVSLAEWFNYLSASNGKLSAKFEQKAHGKIKRHLEKGVLRTAAENECDAVLCGHTHEPQPFKKFKKGADTTYGNTGSFVAKQSTAMVVTQDGRWRIIDWRKERINRGLDDKPAKDEYNVAAVYRDMSQQEAHFHRTLHKVWASREMLAQAMRTMDKIKEMAALIEDALGGQEEEVHALLKSARPTAMLGLARVVPDPVVLSA